MAKIYSLDAWRQHRERRILSQNTPPPDTVVDSYEYITKKVLQLSNGIKRDVSGLLKLHEQLHLSSEHPHPQLTKRIQACKKRITDRCHDIAYIRKKECIDEDKWQTILESSLRKVSPHAQREELQKKLEILMSTHLHDTSPAGGQFIITYLKIVAGIDITPTLLHLSHPHN